MTHALQSYSEGRWQYGTGEQRPLESTGHGVAMPQMLHGGPGRAGGGEELGGLRAVRHYLQRTAVQGHPDLLATLAGERDR